MLCLVQCSFKRSRKNVIRLSVLQGRTEECSLIASLPCENTKKMKRKAA